MVVRGSGGGATRGGRCGRGARRRALEPAFDLAEAAADAAESEAQVRARHGARALVEAGRLGEVGACLLEAAEVN